MELHGPLPGPGLCASHTWHTGIYATESHTESHIF
ncbi:unnamed protein product [Ceutorhynchus assimilis]|uniref:Uncharacterized protein n=1 Tax=Ceutorhynchus assimilis TaxID=467358 RepID=A0A9N9MEM5_9CUCU|nr:unnamed protein product [Ceutorhynchus assimilis]